MRNNFFIRCTDIKDDEWQLLDTFPKHELCSKLPTQCGYLTLSDKGYLLDMFIMPVYSDRIYTLPEFIEKSSEYRLFLLL